MSHPESVQEMLVNGKCEDIYYANPENTRKECIRTKQTTKYVQALTQLSGGTSVFLVPPQFGLQDVVLQLQLPSATSGGGSATGLALPRGWGYALIKQISYRIGGSTQFFVTGQQMLQHALKRMSNGTSRDDLFALGGQQLTGTALNATNNYAYVWLDLPWSRATSEGKPVPLPSDILSSQVQVTVELLPPSAIMSNNGGTIPAVFGSLASGQFQIQQVLMESRDDSLAAHENMATHSYNMPIEFVQQEQVISLPTATTSVQSVVATGFRSGTVKSIEMWLTKDSDYVSSSTTKNPLKWYAPGDVQVLYAGDVYARFDVGSSALWNLVNSKISPKVAGLDVVYTGGAYTTGTPQNYSWVTAPFAQTYDAADTGSYMLVQGLNVTNGVVNIQFSTPTADTDYRLHLSYIYAATAVFSQSSCEVVF
jgi:hypothetical protein